MEEWGSGYRRTVLACSKGGYPIPEWQEIGSTLRVTFRPYNNLENDPIKSSLNERQIWFIKELSISKNTRMRDIIKEFDVGEATAKRDISTLREKRLIDYVGSLKTGRYILIHPQKNK